MKHTIHLVYAIGILVFLLPSCQHPSDGVLTENQLWDKLEGSWIELGWGKSCEQAEQMINRQESIIDSLKKECRIHPNAECYQYTFLLSGLRKYRLSGHWNIRRAPKLDASSNYPMNFYNQTGEWYMKVSRKSPSPDGYDTIKLITDNNLIFTVLDGNTLKYKALSKIENLFDYNIKVHEAAETIVSKQWYVEAKKIISEGNTDSVNYDIKPLLFSTNRIKDYNTIHGHKIYNADYYINIGTYSHESGIDKEKLSDKLFCSFGYYDFFAKDLYVSVYSLVNGESKGTFAHDAIFRLDNLTDNYMEAVWEKTTDNGTEIITYYLHAL